jgi:rhodanese-related sulfurtransferase
MLAAANASVPRIIPKDAAALIAGGNVLVVDVRDGTELQATGKVQGAVHAPRGMLEFRADPESPYHDKTFDRTKTVIVYCGSGGRSALAGKTLQDMGYKECAISAASRTGPKAAVRSRRSERQRPARGR